jgi:type II secretory pathway component PulK
MNDLPSSPSARRHGLIRHLAKRKASALMLMIWAIMLMAFTVGGVIQYMQGSLKQNSDAANQYRAAYMAECGIGLAMNPNVWVMDAVKGPDGRLVTYIRGKEQKPPGDAGFSLNKVREGSRLPINFITDKRAYEAVYNLFLLWGINNDEATTAMDCLADWVDGDKEARPQGAEADYYQGLQQNGFPRNQGFTSLDEMLLVKGFDVVARAKPDWRNYFSLYGEGTIDLFWASKDVIMAVTGAADADVTRLITARAGNDGVDGTDDDNRSIGITGAISMLGIPADRIPFVQALTTYASDKVFRIVSMGYVGTHSVTITVVAKMQDDGSLTYLARSEE